MDRDALEQFVKEQDAENKMNTEERFTQMPRTTPSCSPQLSEEISFSPPSTGKRPVLLHVTPTKPTTDSHPLKDGNECIENKSVNSNSIKRNNTRARKSLIMPVVSLEQAGKQNSIPVDGVFGTPLGRKQRGRTASIDSQKSVRSSVRSNEPIIGEEGRHSVQFESGDNSTATYNSNDLIKPDSNLSKENVEISDLLQSLANKELEILERTRKVNDLKRQIMQEDKLIHEAEFELDKLKMKVSELIGNKVTNDNPTLTSTYYHRGGAQDKSDVGRNNESLWTKSVSLLNQFDQMIQGTVENGLGFVDHMEGDENQAITSDTNAKKSDEKSIWSFVQEFKQGLGLNSIKEESGGTTRDTEMRGLTYHIPKGVHDTGNINQLKFVANSVPQLNDDDQHASAKEI